MRPLLTMFLAALDRPSWRRRCDTAASSTTSATCPGHHVLSSGSTAVAPVFGTLSYIIWPRVMITSAVLFTVGSILCAVAPNMTV